MDESRANKLHNFSSLSGDLARAPDGPDSISAIDSTDEPVFVINLCAAMTPIDLSSQALVGLDQYKLYQVSRMEDGRRRYRLRLGFFTSVTRAEDVLASVRARYATAFTSCLCEEDLKHATGYLKCSVKDLERTGRYSVQKLRGDSGGTTALRVITPAALQHLQAAESRTVGSIAPAATAAGKPPASTATVLPIRVPPPYRPIVPTTPRSSAPTVASERRQPGSPLRAPITGPLTRAPQPAAADQTQTLKALIMTPANAPKRESLMRRAHAMAPVDAVERAKGVPGNAASAFVDHLATGKFKQAQAATQAVAPPAARPSVSAAPVTPRPIATIVTPPAIPSVPATKASSVVPGRVLEARTPPLQTPRAPIQKNNQAFHVGAGVNIPETTLSLAAPEASLARATALTPSSVAPSKTQVSPIALPTPAASTTNDLSRARELAKQSVQWRQDHGEVPTLDTTQTIRTLTKTELANTNSPKWFAVQLAISDRAANLDTMPKLDIFDAYSLYSVAVMEGSGIRHALRLGFFREEASAMAVMGYLKTFFTEPVITRIPDAEYERFIGAPKVSALTKLATNNITLDEKHAAKHSPIANNVPTISAAVERTPSMSKQPPRAAPQPKPMARAAGPATKHAVASPPTSKRPVANSGNSARASQKDLLDEAQLLGLSDSAILRVQKNPSLLSRLVGKLGK